MRPAARNRCCWRAACDSRRARGWKSRLPRTRGSLFSLKSRSLPVAARIARGNVAFNGRIAQAPDELPGAKILIAVMNDFDLMAQRGQIAPGLFRHGGFDVDRQALIESPPRRIAGG